MGKPGPVAARAESGAPARSLGHSLSLSPFAALSCTGPRPSLSFSALVRLLTLLQTRSSNYQH